jgi:hypothetical protein
MEFNLTTGEWHQGVEFVVLPPGTYVCVLNPENGAANVMAICGAVVDDDAEQTIANARAMAAAKDMLGLLPSARQLLLQSFVGEASKLEQAELRRVIDAIDSAIAKGTGKPVELVQAELDIAYTEMAAEIAERARIEAESRP